MPRPPENTVEQAVLDEYLSYLASIGELDPEEETEDNE